MPKFNLSFKHVEIDKSAKTIIMAVTLATAVTIFSIVGSHQLLAKLSYQNRVISAKRAANKQLQNNIKATTTLVESYKTFESKSPSIIGTADKNSKIILDALPSKYDFPALTSSLEKILTLNGYAINNIQGTDDEVAQVVPAESSKIVEIPFSISVKSNFDNIKKLIVDFGRSIRPIRIKNMQLSGGEGNMEIVINAKTYYQTEQRLDITSQEIK